MPNGTVVPSRPRITPRVWIGLAIWLGDFVGVYAIQALSGIPYDNWGDNAGNLFRGAGISLIVATLLLALTTHLLGWWGPALYEHRRSKHKWLLFIPALVVLAGLLNLAGTDWSAYTGAFLASSLVLTLVGFTEEITNRGLLLTGLRARLREGWVWFITSALFGLSHLINVALGADAGGTLLQVFFAFMAGTVFYILRRVTGSLLWAMLLHGFWDFSVFAVGIGEASEIAAFANIIEPVAGIIALVCVVFVIRDADESQRAIADRK